ncbi:Caffeoylshikimate esterase [Nymphaea thermarum]|nr:Caffeoylshikimate esterase [Nymphaea thermarum]
MADSPVLPSPSLSPSSSTSPESLILTSGATVRVNALLSLRSLRTLLAFLNAVLLFLLVPFLPRSRRSSSAMERPKDERKQRHEAIVGTGGGAVPAVRVPAALVPRRLAAAVSLEGEVSSRRALAIRNVRDDESSESIREFSLFATGRGETLFTQSWTPAFAKTRALVIILHGLNEHRYSSFAKKLNNNGYKVYGMDWTGHGGSDGLHGYVPSLDNAVNDLKAFLVKVVVDNPGLPCFLFGHSTGASIILKAVLDPKVENVVEGIVLTSPAVRVQPSHPIYGVIAPILSCLLPRYQIGGADKKGQPVSRDPEALIAKYSDPLVYTGSIRIRTGCEILRVTSSLQENLKKITVPFLVLHGSADTLTDPDASRALYEEASSVDKTIKLYEGFLHDLLFEPEKDLIMKDIIDWLNSRL